MWAGDHAAWIAAIGLIYKNQVMRTGDQDPWNVATLFCIWTILGTQNIISFQKNDGISFYQVIYVAKECGSTIN